MSYRKKQSRNGGPNEDSNSKLYRSSTTYDISDAAKVMAAVNAFTAIENALVYENDESKKIEEFVYATNISTLDSMLNSGEIDDVNVRQIVVV